MWTLYWVAFGFGALAAIAWVLLRYIIPCIIVGTVGIIKALVEAWPRMVAAFKKGLQGTEGAPKK